MNILLISLPPWLCPFQISTTKRARCRGVSHALSRLRRARSRRRMRSLRAIVRSHGWNRCCLHAFHYRNRGGRARVLSRFVGGAPLIYAPWHCDGFNGSHLLPWGFDNQVLIWILIRSPLSKETLGVQCGASFPHSTWVIQGGTAGLETGRIHNEQRKTPFSTKRKK